MPAATAFFDQGPATQLVIPFVIGFNEHYVLAGDLGHLPYISQASAMLVKNDVALLIPSRNQCSAAGSSQAATVVGDNNRVAQAGCASSVTIG